VTDPRHYVSKASVLTRWLRDGNSQMAGSPVTVSATAIDGDLPEVLSVIEEHLAGRPVVA
jgi:hypothetical protein